MIVAMFVSFGIAYFIAGKYFEHQSQVGVTPLLLRQ
jgi:hypothetical protein